jgi:hypothetical protein
MMNRRLIAAAMVVAASAFTTGAMYAAPVAAKSPVLTSSSKPKMVSFKLQNATSTAIKVKAGDAEMTLEPGTTTPVKLPVGTKLVSEVTVPHYEEGSVIAVVSQDLGEGTIVLQ